MAELADALGSGPSSRQGSAGSSPVFGTLYSKRTYGSFVVSPFLLSCSEWTVDLVSLKDRFSLVPTAGRLHARILASVAEYETAVRAERVAAGQAVARRKGKKWGGSKPGWRWKVSDDQVAYCPCSSRNRKMSGTYAIVAV